MTRVVVQRGSGPANSSQSRPPSAPPSGSPSAPPSAPASSSSTPPLPCSQLLPSSSQVPLPSSSVSHSHSSGFFSSGDEGQDQITNEDQRFNDVVELQTLVPDTITETLASSSLLDARGSSGQVNLEGHVESTGALEAHGSEDLRAKLKEPELVSHLQHDPELERLQEAPDRQHLGVGEDAVRTAEIAKVAVDGERGDDSLENLSLCSEDLSVPFSAASTGQRKQEDGGTSTSSIPQGHYSSGQNVMQSSSPALMSTTFVPLSMPIPYPPLPVQSVMHSLPLPPLSGQYSPSLLAGAHPFPRSHEENDSGRPMGNPNVSEAIGCSYLSAPTPSVPFIPSSSSRRTRGGVTFRRIPRGLKGSRNSPNSSRPTSPRTYGEGDGYNSADEQGPWGSGSSGYEDNGERERQFENELRRVKNLEVRRMAEDGNCLFRSIADQIYGDAEMYSETRQMCIDYMEKERDHFSQFVTESFTAYCKRKRRDKVYGNNLEIQAMAEMYNRPIHIYSYSTEPINIFHGSYETDLPPIRLSYHRSNHYNSLLDPCNPAVGAGLGFGSLRGRNVDTEQVKAALKAQQEQQIDKALIAEGRFYSDMELTEQEIERMVMEASRAEFLAGESFRLQSPWQEETSTSAGAEPSSSGTTGSPRSTIVAQGGSQQTIGDSVSPPATSTGGAEEAVSSNVRMLLSMGFSYLQVMEAHSIFGDNVNNMLCYLLETETNGSDDGENVSRRKGKAAE